MALSYLAAAELLDAGAVAPVVDLWGIAACVVQFEPEPAVSGVFGARRRQMRQRQSFTKLALVAACAEVKKVHYYHRVSVCAPLGGEPAEVHRRDHQVPAVPQRGQAGGFTVEHRGVARAGFNEELVATAGFANKKRSPPGTALLFVPGNSAETQGGLD